MGVSLPPRVDVVKCRAVIDCCELRLLFSWRVELLLAVGGLLSSRSPPSSVVTAVLCFLYSARVHRLVAEARSSPFLKDASNSRHRASQSSELHRTTTHQSPSASSSIAAHQPPPTAFRPCFWTGDLFATAPPHQYKHQNTNPSRDRIAPQ
ncbi:hypothetical protein FN846DRAFT_976974 [Sphaerosporella brunnea]|uniref:Uncharacterized protein n=1 Tax=Sphaerosporella brunnea TaxID=1250544 RepID=A0A5J5EGH2_9PEZI|nr:hypothetical protein FN846DRAFT_976974 [Sphaerosporella brunnea]